jgi:hypothetical protein
VGELVVVVVFDVVINFAFLKGVLFMAFRTFNDCAE